jgi:hypothetical protein
VSRAAAPAAQAPALDIERSPYCAESISVNVQTRGLRTRGMGISHTGSTGFAHRLAHPSMQQVLPVFREAALATRVHIVYIVERLFSARVVGSAYSALLTDSSLAVCFESQ